MRVVVSKKVGGLGACLVTLFRAWQFARRAGRTLVVDWRASLYERDPRVNAFGRLFANRGWIADVPIVTGDRVAGLDYPEPFFPPGWSADRLHRFPDRYYTAAALDRVEPQRLGSRRAQFELCIGGEDPPHPTVVLHHGLRSPDPVDPGDEHFPRLDSEAARAFLQALEPQPEIHEAAADFAARRLAARPIVGLHVRHGNGEREERVTGETTPRLNRDPETLLAAFRVALAATPRERGVPTTIFLATDSVAVQELFTRELPQIVTYPKRLRPAGHGALHAGPDEDGGRDALVEMLLLARCDALVHNDSCFTFLPIFGGDHAWRARVSPASPAAVAASRAATIRSTASS
jgi:hypothetical protein